MHSWVKETGLPMLGGTVSVWEESSGCSNLGGRRFGGCFLHTLSTLVLSFHRQHSVNIRIRKAVASFTPVEPLPFLPGTKSWMSLTWLAHVITHILYHTYRTLSTLYTERPSWSPIVLKCAYLFK